MLDLLQLIWTELVRNPLVALVAGIMLMAVLTAPAIRLRERRVERRLGLDVDFWELAAARALEGPDALLAGCRGSAAPRHRGAVVTVREDVTLLKHGLTGRSRRRAVVHSTPPVAGVVGTTEVSEEAVEEGWHPADEGRLVVTDRGVGFEGVAGSETIPWAAVEDVVIFSGQTIHEVRRRDGPHRRFVSPRPDPEFSASIWLAAVYATAEREPLSAT